MHVNNSFSPRYCGNYQKSRKLSILQSLQHFTTYICYHAKRLGWTIKTKDKWTNATQRHFVDQWSLKRHARSILLGLILLSIPIYFIMSNTDKENKHLEKDNNFKEVGHLVNEMTKDMWGRPGYGIPEKRAGERSIKSYEDPEQHNMKNSLSAADAKSVFRDDSFVSIKPLCPAIPPNLLGRLEFRFNDTPPTFKDTALNNPNLKEGGFYEPHNCIAQTKVAVIIPHRARELHLRALLWHLHPILQRQQLYYKVYVAHQAYNLPFNKAKMMNIGFLEAMKDDNFDCVIFHDVDLLPEDDRLLYHCRETPKHLSVAIDKYGYKLPYTSLFGGVTMLSMDQFRDVNGYSNMYWGWGGEDDDMFNRVFSRGYTIHRPPFHLARYKMSFHHRDKGNRLNLMRYEILSRSIHRMQDDGLNNVKYDIVSIDATPIFTNITADVGTALIQCKPYLSDWTCNFVMWMCEYLTLSCGMLQYNSTDDGTLNMPANSQRIK